MKKKIAIRIGCLVALGYIPGILLLSGIHFGSVYQIAVGIGGFIVLILFGLLNVEEVRAVESLKSYIEVLKTANADSHAIIKQQANMIHRLAHGLDHDELDG